MPPSAPPTADALAALASAMLYAGVGVGLLFALMVCLCFSPLTEYTEGVRECSRSTIKLLRTLYGADDSQHAAFKAVEKAAADKADACGSRNSEWASLTQDRFAAERAAKTEAEVEQLRRQLRHAVRDAEGRVSAAQQAEARRAALVAERDHVADEAAGTIEGVMLDADKWMEEARNAPPEQKAHMTFLARTMASVGSAALEPYAPAARGSHFALRLSSPVSCDCLSSWTAYATTLPSRVIV
jgi:hypothetical protein